MKATTDFEGLVLLIAESLSRIDDGEKAIAVLRIIRPELAITKTVGKPEYKIKQLWKSR